MNFAARTCRRQHGLCRSKEFPSKWLKMLTQRYLFISEICTMVGSAYLFLYVRLHVFFKVCMCTFSPRKSGRPKTRPARPARPLATAMLHQNECTFQKIHSLSTGGAHSRVQASITSPTSPPYVAKQLTALFHTQPLFSFLVYGNV